MRKFCPLIALCGLLVACGGNDLPEVSSEAYSESVSAFYMGVAAVQAGEEAGARASFERVTELAPGEPAAWANLGLLALRRNDFETASAHFARASDLAPENDHIAVLRGLLAASQGKYEDAASHYREAIARNETNVKAAYALAQELERRGGPEAEAEALQIIRGLSRERSDNVALLVESTRLALKLNEREALTEAIAHLNEQEEAWPPEVREQLDALVASVGQDDLRSASTRLAFLRNLMLRLPSFRQNLAEIQTPVEQPGDFAIHFIRLPKPPRDPAPADTSLQFSAMASSPASGAAAAAGVVYLDGNRPPVPYAVRGSTIEMSGGGTLPFPGDAHSLEPGAQPVAPLDFDYDFATDLAAAGPGGFRLYRGDSTGAFLDVTSATMLPPAITAGTYSGVWVLDADLEGDLDLLLARAAGPPLVLRNNADGTFDVLELFGDVAGVRSFAWADLDEDADPDAAIVDGTGRLHVYLNDRGGLFRRVTPELGGPLVHVSVADIDGDGRFDLLALGEDGAVSVVDEAAELLLPARATAEPVRLLVADLDNNGAMDVIRSRADGSDLYLNGTEGISGAYLIEVPGSVSGVADVNGDGRLDLLTAGAEGITILQNDGTREYRWQVIRPRAALAQGDQRINSFGIGGQIDARSGLYYQKQVIDAPRIHFGLGMQSGTDVARIIWPNGDIQAEFNLSPDQDLLTQQRLKGSCPWVFAFDGKEMAFVTDFIWRSPLGLAINGQAQADVVLTADRVKIPGDKLVARDGYYDIRVTAELWETHFFDEVSLMVVDHPQNTEMFVDERFSIPAPDLTPHIMKPVQPVASAWDDRGRDITPTLIQRDRRFAGTFERGRYQGVAGDHFVEVDLGPNVPTGRPVWLVAQGWVRPTDSSVNVAMGQGDHPGPKSLQLEVRTPGGDWHVAASNLGFPAGKEKTLLIPIGEVVSKYPGARIRLRTNLEVYWDALGWAEALPDAAVRISRHEPAVADLQYRGYSEVTTADESSPEIPHYGSLRSKSRQWYDLEGFYTRFGDVRPLLATVDDRYVIMNAGDEMRFLFTELPPPRDGFVRDFLLVGDGWVKDGDFNTSYSKTVRPLPRHVDTAYRGPLVPLEQDPAYLANPGDWQEFHTRYVAPDGFSEALAR